MNQVCDAFECSHGPAGGMTAQEAAVVVEDCCAVFGDCLCRRCGYRYSQHVGGSDED